MQYIRVLDSNCLFKIQNLTQLSIKYSLFTTNSVFEQILDQKTKDKIIHSLVTIKIKSPTLHNINKIKEFALNTGDLNSLSKTDIQLIALTLQLYINNGMSQHIKFKPIQQQSTFKVKQTQKQQELNQHDDYSQEDLSDDQNSQDELQKDGWINVDKKKKKKKNQEKQMDDQQGWISSQNINEVFNSSYKKQIEEQSKISLMTQDYAMQNICLQMGISIVAITGLKIKEIKKYVTQCYLCNYLIKQLNYNKLALCPKCGYNSLCKITCSINDKEKKLDPKQKGVRQKIKTNELEKKQTQKKKEKKRRSS